MLNTPVGGHRKLPVKARQFRIACDGRLHVSGQVNFRNHSDEQAVRIPDDLSDLLLRIKAAVRTQAEVCVAAAGAVLRQERVLFDLNAPALILRQMPVKSIKLLQRHPVQESFNLFHWIVITPRIQHKPTEWKTRPVRYAQGGDLPAIALEDQLLERL